MNWTVWIASKHALLVHLPIAAALMIPFPVIAAQRGGRGIRPWWTTCRFLAWVGFLGSLLALATGLALARSQGILATGTLWAAAPPGRAYLFRIHELGGAVALVLAGLCLKSLYRNRQEHQGIGIPALLLALAWCAVAFLSAFTGSILVRQRNAPALLQAPPAAASQPSS